MEEYLSEAQKAEIKACFAVADGMMDDVYFAYVEGVIATTEAIGGAIGVAGQAYTTFVECIITVGADCPGNLASLVDDIIETLASVADAMNSFDEAESNLATARAKIEECKARCHVYSEQSAADEGQEERLSELEAQIDQQKAEIEALRQDLQMALEQLQGVQED
jgi:predicted RNase H-like nuclease (RuvC/YqgF family)